MIGVINVLYIGDDEREFEEFRTHLDEPQATELRFHIAWCNDYGEALRALTRNLYDVYFIAQYPAGFPHSGTEIIEMVNEGGCESPVVLVTAMDDEDIDQEAARVGAAFYLNRNLDVSQRMLIVVIRFAIKQSRNIINLRMRLQALEAQVANTVKEMFKYRGG